MPVVRFPSKRPGSVRAVFVVFDPLPVRGESNAIAAILVVVGVLVDYLEQARGLRVLLHLRKFLEPVSAQRQCFFSPHDCKPPNRERLSGRDGQKARHKSNLVSSFRGRSIALPGCFRFDLFRVAVAV